MGLIKISTDDYRFVGKPAVATSDDKTYVFVRSPRGTVYWKYYDGSKWTPNETTFNTLADDNVLVVNDLTAAGRSDKIVDLFFVDVEQRVQWNKYDGSSWSGWKAISDGGGYLNVVAAISNTDSQAIDLFVRRIDNTVHHKRYDGTTWSPPDSGSVWKSLGVTNMFKGGPTSVAATDDSFFVFARGGADNHLYVKRGSSDEIHASGSGAKTWTDLSGELVADVSAVSPSSGNVVTFHLGFAKAHAYLKSFNGDNWDDQYTDIGGPLLSTPVARATDSGKVHLFALATNNHISTAEWDPATKKITGWSNVANQAWTAEPVLNPNKNQVFLRDARGLLHFYVY